MTFILTIVQIVLLYCLLLFVCKDKYHNKILKYVCYSIFTAINIILLTDTFSGLIQVFITVMLFNLYLFWVLKKYNHLKTFLIIPVSIGLGYLGVRLEGHVLAESYLLVWCFFIPTLLIYKPLNTKSFKEYSVVVLSVILMLSVAFASSSDVNTSDKGKHVTAGYAYLESHFNDAHLKIQTKNTFRGQLVELVATDYKETIEIKMYYQKDQILEDKTIETRSLTQ